MFLIPAISVLTVAGLAGAIDPSHVTHAFLAYIVVDTVRGRRRLSSSPHLTLLQIACRRRCGRRRLLLLALTPLCLCPLPHRCPRAQVWVAVEPDAVPSLPRIILLHHAVTAALLAVAIAHPHMHKYAPAGC